MGLVIRKWGNSNAVRLPQKLTDALNWSVDEELDISITEDALTLKRAVKKRDIQDLFAGFEGRISEAEIDWGKPQGGEVW